MTDPIPQLILLAVALSGVGSHPGARQRSGLLWSASARPWTHAVAEAERGGLDLVTLADGPPQRAIGGGAADRPDGGRPRDRAARDGSATRLPWLDAALIACRVAPASLEIGLLPEIPTVTTEPFLVSTQVATLDHISGGRGGWSVVVSEQGSDGGYVGPRPVPPLADRFAEAAEHIEAVRRLWDSWEDDAEIRDAASNRFVDRERLHHIDYAGRWLAVKGPSITPRPPQGQPIVAVTIRGERSLQLAAEQADLAFVASGPGLLETARRLGEAVAAGGRDPDQIRVLAELEVVLARDAGAARDRAAALDAVSLDAAGLDGATRCDSGDDRIFAGTPGALAERLIETRVGVHGFRLHPAEIAEDLPLITRALPAELNARGARTRDRNRRPASLRDRLGLPRPANRYASTRR